MNKELESKGIAADLCKLALLLNTYGLCSDVSALDSAGQSFINEESSAWRYNLKKITFNNVDEVGGRMPSDAEDISVSLSMNIEGIQDDGANVANPLTVLALDIEIDGSRIDPATIDSVDDLYACWHLDMHIEEPGDGVPKYSHPLFHMAFGGNKLEGRGNAFFGNGVILPSPRLMYPPMDAVLGIDFILQNYFEKNKIQQLLGDPEYVEIVRNSQERLWKPFFASLYSHWESTLSVEQNFINKKLFPFYC